MPADLPQSEKYAASRRILAIDGPAGAGKSTIATQMAARFQLLNIETGAMYRAFALKAIDCGISVDDATALASLTARPSIELCPAAPGNTVLLDSRDVTGSLRAPAISEAASRVSVHASVRAWMVHHQQQLGHRLLATSSVPGIVLEGRDIGTVVFPDAGLKIFLSASPEARAERRLVQSSGNDASAVLAAIHERDHRDSTRSASPLRAAPDAIAIDSTSLSLNEVIARVTSLVVERWRLTPVTPSKQVT